MYNMTDNKFYQIFVPTYKRSSPAILKMLDTDSALTINFCVRDEEWNNEAYTKIKGKYANRAKFINLGKHIHDIGETRRRILKYAQQHNIMYCIMIDDGITNFVNTKELMSIEECLFISTMTLDKYNQTKEYKAIAYTFRRKEDKFVGVDSDDKICCGMMQQAYIIDCRLAEQYNISFKSLDKVGFEDAAFMLDAFKAGLCTISTPGVFMEGKAPNVIQKGGNHVDTDVDNFAKSYDEKSRRLSKYVGKMYGVSFEKKFRKRYLAQVTYCIVNYAYFREVLSTHREFNSMLVDSKFKM